MDEINNNFNFLLPVSSASDTVWVVWVLLLGGEERHASSAGTEGVQRLQEISAGTVKHLIDLFNPEFIIAISISIHYKPRFAIAILDF